jgi:hypothetical protein
MQGADSERRARIEALVQYLCSPTCGGRASARPYLVAVSGRAMGGSGRGRVPGSK